MKGGQIYQGWDSPHVLFDFSLLTVKHSYQQPEKAPAWLWRPLLGICKRAGWSTLTQISLTSTLWMQTSRLLCDFLKIFALYRDSCGRIQQPNCHMPSHIFFLSRTAYCWYYIHYVILHGRPTDISYMWVGQTSLMYDCLWGFNQTIQKWKNKPKLLWNQSSVRQGRLLLLLKSSISNVNC